MRSRSLIECLGHVYLDWLGSLIRRLSDSLVAFLAARKRSRREVAVILNRIPAGFDAAHVGFVVIDVRGSGHCGDPVRSSYRPSRSDCWQFSCPGQNRCCRCLMCLPTAPVLPTKGKETSVNPNFIGSFQTSAARLVSHMATRILSAIGVVFYLTFQLQLSAARRQAATSANSTVAKEPVETTPCTCISAKWDCVRRLEKWLSLSNPLVPMLTLSSAPPLACRRLRDASAPALKEECRVRVQRSKIRATVHALCGRV